MTRARAKGQVPDYARAAMTRAIEAGNVAPEPALFSAPRGQQEGAERLLRDGEVPQYHLAFLERLEAAEADGYADEVASDCLWAIRELWAQPEGVKAWPWTRPRIPRLWLLLGVPGCGKTTSLAAAGRAAARVGARPGFVRASAIPELKRTGQLGKVRRTHVLLLDDLHKAAPGPWLDELHELVDRFYSDPRRAIVAAAKGVGAEREDLAALEARLGAEIVGRLTDRWAGARVVVGARLDFRRGPRGAGGGA